MRIAAGASQTVTVRADLADLASFDAARVATVLESGDDVVRVGTSSRDTVPAAVVDLRETAIVRKVHDVLGDPGFTDFKPASPVAVAVDVPADAPRLALEPSVVRREDTTQPVDLSDALELVRSLSDEDLSYIVLGQYAETADSQSIIGQASDALVGAEMDYFGAHLWLAPAFDLHRSILCGRNFEYLSEDPLLGGRIAGDVTRGVQSHPGRGVTVKHFAFNEQETNRLHSDSHVSQRAARDLYLRTFEYVVRETQPHAIMTSYNLVNGVHTSQSRELLEDVLRSERGFQGLVMTDWVVYSMTRTDLKHPRATAAATIKAGNELFMPGCEEDHKDVIAGLTGGAEGGVALSRADLEKAAARVVRMARLLGNAAAPATRQK